MQKHNAEPPPTRDEVVRLKAVIENYEQALRGIKRAFGHKSINAGTSTLGLFIDQILSYNNQLPTLTAELKRLWEYFDSQREKAAGREPSDCYHQLQLAREAAVYLDAANQVKGSMQTMEDALNSLSTDTTE